MTNKQKITDTSCPSCWENKNNIDELKELFETMQKDVAMCNHLSDSYLADLNNIIKEVEQRKVDEIIEIISKMKLWSKGNVEGTRQDIIYKLKNK